MQRNFLRGLLICLIPIALFGAAAVFGTYRPGIDLAGGTILVYEVDLSKKETGSTTESTDGLSSDEMQRLAESLKKRIDPADTKNIIIRPLGSTRVEIIIPFTPTSKKEAGTEDFVQDVKENVARVGVLEFRIVANDKDDTEPVKDAQDKLLAMSPEELTSLAKAGKVPPGPGRVYDKITVNGVDATNVTYEWVELGREERYSLGLNEDADKRKSRGGLWETLAANRGKPFLYQMNTDKEGRRDNMLLFSRDYQDENPRPGDKGKKVEYFMLTRVSELDQVKVGGDVGLTARADSKNLDWVVAFQFNGAGIPKFTQMTSRNKPTSGEFIRHLAAILDNRVVSAPRLNSELPGAGIIEGNFTKNDVERMVFILRSGALTAALKPNPVSENFVTATLGRDTITKGLSSVVLAFAAVMVFMVVYYQLAGMVACIALLVNLLQTIGFMVFVNAAFTLAGLAGIVLMLGMAVDANVLIYERLREEREKGALLGAALRAGYDRALPTILDTHLTSIFTAIVLFVFGTDNLKGFAVSLTVGLIISLFTSLYITRLIFDYCLSRRWTRELRMMRLFAQPNINFMGVRKLMFTITGVATVAGLVMFLGRGDAGLNVDFRGGTVYGGRLADAKNLSELLGLMSEQEQAKKLQVKDVREVKAEGKATSNLWEVYYEGETKPVVITLANAPADANELKTRASKLPDVSVEQVIVGDLDKDLASGTSRSFTVRTTEKEKELVQIMLDRLLRDGSERPLLASPKLTTWTTAGAAVTVKFSQPASVGYVDSLLKRVFQLKGREPLAGSSFVLTGVASADGSPERVEEVKTGKFSTMKLDVANNSEFIALKDAVTNAAEAAKPGVTAVIGALPVGFADTKKAAEDRAALDAILQELKGTFEARPVPERLETFDAALAAETQSRALFAVVASWVAIMLYLWFRFGSWTFGLAAVFCLIHDLCFTLGAIALCHYLHALPGANLFLIQDFKIDLAAVAALLTLVGYSVNDTIVVFDRIREVRGKNPLLTPQMINDSVNQTLSRTVLASLTVFLVVGVLYWFGGDGVHLFAFVMVVGVIVGTYSSIYIASPLLLIFGEGQPKTETTATTGTALAAK